MNGRVLLFLGAGASKPFNVPTMKEMVEEFGYSLGSEERKFYEEISNSLINRHKRFDLETFLMVLEALEDPDRWHPFASYILDKFNKDYNAIIDPKKVIDAPSLSQDLKKFVRDKCYLNKNEYDKNKDLYELLLKLANEITGQSGGLIGTSVNGIYTTNYDRYIDEYLREKFSRGYSSNVTDYFDRKDNPETLRIDYEKFLANYSPPMEFVKVHGSVNWYLDNGTVVRTDNPRTDFKSGIMIYPTSDKPLYKEPWMKLLILLKRALTRSSVWIVVGYSFNDEVILNLFKEALEERDKTVKLIILSKGAERIRRNYFMQYNENVIALPVNFEDIRTKYDDIVLEILSNGGKDPVVVSWPKSKGIFDGPRLVLVGNTAYHMRAGPNEIDAWASKNFPRMELSVGKPENERNMDYKRFVSDNNLNEVNGTKMGDNRLGFLLNKIKEYQESLKKSTESQFHYLK